MYAAGDSYGGVVAMIQGALDPNITAAAPISGGGGLTHIAAHSSLIPTAVLEQIISPLLIAVPATSRDASAQLPSSCQSGQTSLRFEVNDLFNTRELEIACLDATDFSPGMTVTAYNTRNDVTNCARVGAGGTLRIPVPGNVGDNVLVQVFKQTDAVESYGTCLLKPGALETAGKLVDTWEVGASTFTPVTTGGSCSSGNGCQQFRDTFYDVGSPLVLPQEGLGYSRQTPNFRRLLDITQAALDTADPVNFAPYYMMRPLIGIDGETLPPRGVLVSSTVGDPYVPIAAGTAFARAAGAVPFLPPSAVQTMPEYADYATPSSLDDTVGGVPNDLLIANHVVEGVARLGRTHAGPNCGVNYLPNPDPSLQCGTVPAPDPTVCAQTLYDIDWASEGTNNDDAPHPQNPAAPRSIDERARQGRPLARAGLGPPPLRARAEQPRHDRSERARRRAHERVHQSRRTARVLHQRPVPELRRRHVLRHPARALSGLGRQGRLRALPPADAQVHGHAELPVPPVSDADRRADGGLRARSH